MKLKEKIKEKSIKLSARIFGIMTACLSSAIAAFADVETDATSGVWASVATWITKNKNGLSIAAKALLGLCLVGVVICLGASGKNGISSVKGWLIAILFIFTSFLLPYIFLDVFRYS